MASLVSPSGFLFLLSFLLVLIGASTAATNVKGTVKYHEIRRKDFSIRSTNFGATILSVVLPDSKGNLADVALGFDTSNGMATYISNKTMFGALVGRVANRIAGARFTLNGKTYKLFANDGNNTLHGGKTGFSHVLWSVKKITYGNYPSITYYYHSFDGEGGFPGDLDVYVTYKITGDYEFTVSMRASPRTKPTPVNLVQHTYWNLAGHNSGSILSHAVQIFASRVTPTDGDLIPTGEFEPVAGTPFDFLTPHEVGSRIEEAGGYDINYVLDGADRKLGMQRVAMVKENRTGRGFELWSNQPGVQLYTSNTLRATGKGGYEYKPYAGLCLETQGFPNAVNQPNFPSQIVYPGEAYKHKMVFRFSFE